MKSVVFVGPSLAGAIPDSTDSTSVRPPAQQGDLIGAAVEGAERIVLIDGFFGQRLSVWHKEILEALRMGVDVVGAASMGALRALECETYGMRGIGRVFNLYKRGLISRDDEVALAHADEEHGWHNLSLPLVNVRMTVARVCGTGAISLERGEEIVDAMATVFYAERHCWEIAANDQEVQLLEASYLNVKRLDAWQALREIEQPSQTPEVSPVDFPRHGMLWDEDRVVSIGAERRRLHEITTPAIAAELGELRAIALRFAEECGIPRQRFDNDADQAAEDFRVIAQAKEWMASTGFRSLAAQQRVYAGASLISG